VAREVVEAHVPVTARQAQIAIAKDAVAGASASRALNVERIRHAQGLPLEVLQSNQALAQAQREYLRTIVDYTVAQFSLYRALGWPKTLGVLPSVAPRRRRAEGVIRPGSSRSSPASRVAGVRSSCGRSCGGEISG
jgi:outer membrane protein TolC